MFKDLVDKDSRYNENILDKSGKVRWNQVYNLFVVRLKFVVKKRWMDVVLDNQIITKMIVLLE